MFENDFDHASMLSRQANDSRWGTIVQSLLKSGINRPPKGAHNDKAHPPIHPTSPGRELSGDDVAVYEFVTRRYIACLSQDAKGLETCVKLQVGSEEFCTKGNDRHA
jgi:DNA topoisomerase III